MPTSVFLLSQQHCRSSALCTPFTLAVYVLYTSLTRNGLYQVIHHILNPEEPEFLSSCSKCTKGIYPREKFRCEECEKDLEFCKARRILFISLAREASF